MLTTKCPIRPSRHPCLGPIWLTVGIPVLQGSTSWVIYRCAYSQLMRLRGVEIVHGVFQIRVASCKHAGQLGAPCQFITQLVDPCIPVLSALNQTGTPTLVDCRIRLKGASATADDSQAPDACLMRSPSRRRVLNLLRCRVRPPVYGLPSKYSLNPPLQRAGEIWNRRLFELAICKWLPSSTA